MLPRPLSSFLTFLSVYFQGSFWSLKGVTFLLALGLHINCGCQKLKPCRQKWRGVGGVIGWYNWEVRFILRYHLAQRLRWCAEECLSDSPPVPSPFLPSFTSRFALGLGRGERQVYSSPHWANPVWRKQKFRDWLSPDLPGPVTELVLASICTARVTWQLLERGDEGKTPKLHDLRKWGWVAPQKKN